MAVIKFLFSNSNIQIILTPFFVLLSIIMLPKSAFAFECPNGNQIRWVAANANTDLFSTADAACAAYDMSLIGRPTFYFVYSELLSNGQNYSCYHRSDTAQTPESDPINFINTAITCTPIIQSPPDKNDGCPKINGVGNPCNVATGNKYQSETDFTNTDIVFSRSYNSLNLANVGLGLGWRSNYQKILIVLTDSLTRVSSTGRGEPWTKVSGAWQGDADSNVLITEDANGFQLIEANGVIERYSLTGQLLSITDVRGNIQILSYDTNNRLDQVDTNKGEFIQFTYDTLDHINTIIDHAGRTWTYRYDSKNNLEFVDNPDGTTKQYHYNEQAFTSSADLPHALTGITDERGMRYATYEYHADGWAKATYHAGNTQRVEITYNDTNGTRTVTNSLGQPSTYATATQLGVSLVTDVSGPGCATCGSGNTDYDYDPANNNLLVRIENGITTKFNNYDSKGQFSCKVEGITSTDTSTGVCAFDSVASPEARRTDYTYDSRFNNKTSTISAPSVFGANP